MADNYWARVLDKRIGRRRALKVTGASAAAAAFLAACGGDDNGSSSTGSSAPEDKSGLLTTPAGPVAKAIARNARRSGPEPVEADEPRVAVAP